MKKIRIVLFLCTLWVSVVTAEYVTVPDHQPIQPGEHPRLLFRKSDLPELRRRAQTPTGKRLVERLKATLGGGEAVPGPGMRHSAKRAYTERVVLPEGAYSVSHAAGFGMLYQLTGDKKYAELAKECMELGFAQVRDRDSSARYAMILGGGQLRVGPSLAWTALAYDLCYDAWSPDYRKKVADFILNYNVDHYHFLDASDKERKSKKKNRYSTSSMAQRPAHHPSSNHFGSITGGIGMALLALYQDPEVDRKKVAELLAANEKHTVKALNGFGPRGFFFEGQGPSHMGAYPAMVSYFQALRNVMGRDYISENERMQWISLRWIGEVTNDQKGVPVYLARHEAMGQSYGNDLLLPDGSLSGNGRFSLGFGSLPEKYHPYFLWSFENYFAQVDQGRLDTRNYPHLAISALINWPIGVAAQHPQGIFPTAYRDQQFGHYVFRNGWHGNTDDIVVTAFTAKQGSTRRKPWSKGGLPIKIRAYGKKHEMELGWKEKKLNEVDWQQRNQTTTVAFDDGTLLATDFSGRSKTGGIIVMRPGTRSWKGFDSGYFGEFFAQHANGLAVLSIQKNHMHPKLEADGDGVRIGGLRITVVGDRLKLEGTSTATELVDSFAIRKIDPNLDQVSAETLRHPGRPDALLSFDYQDFEQRGMDAYFREAFGRTDASWAFNLRPEHLRPGVFGQAYPMRPRSNPESILPGADPKVDAAIEHPMGFTGILTGILLPDHPDWNFGPDSQTVTFWLRFNQPRSGASMLLEPKGFHTFHMGFHGGPTTMIGGAYGSLNAPYPNDTDWHHIALVYDQQRQLVTYYVDGVLTGRAKGKGRNTEARGPTVISGRWPNGKRFPGIATEGDMDEWAMYNRALTAGEVAALHQAAEQGRSLTERPVSRDGVAAYIDVDKPVGAAPHAVAFSAERSAVIADGKWTAGGTYQWDFGDGTAGTGRTLSHTYQQDGRYIATLTVKGADGSISTAQKEINVFNRPPVADIVQVATDEGGFTLDASGSYDPDRGALTFAWSAIGISSSGPTLTVENPPAGSHEITCRVTDEHGATSTAFFTASILDDQGYRLPENPGNVVPGFHYRVMKLHKPVQTRESFTSENVSRLTEPMHSGIVHDLSFNGVTAAGVQKYVLFTGYVRIPRDGTYTFMLDGVKRVRFDIGNDFSMHNAGLHSFLTQPTEQSIKLRKGLHRFTFFHPANVKIKAKSGRPFFMSRLRFKHEDGEHFVLSGQRVVRSPFGPNGPGSDWAALRVPGDPEPEAAGNHSPTISLKQDRIASMPGAQTVRLTAETRDEDDDALTTVWYLPDGSRVAGSNQVTRVLTTGSYVVEAVVEDGRGGSTRASTTINVAGPAVTPSLSFDFAEFKNVGGTMPGETVGIMPSAMWNQVQATYSRQRSKEPVIQVFPQYGENIAKGFGLHQQVWLDNTGQKVPLTIRMHMPVNGSVRGLSQVHNSSPVQRLMRHGISTSKMTIEGVPYQHYDVIVYLLGAAEKDPPPDVWWRTGAPGGKKRRRVYGEPVISINGQQQTFDNTIQHHRWSGNLSELSDDNPKGNVLFFSGLSGTDMTMVLTGGLVAGFQIVEAP